MDYKNGKIYSIRSHQTDEVYIGSTTQPLYKRLAQHRSNKKLYQLKKRGYTTSFKILEFEDAYIELVELYPCNNKEELLKKEGEIIRSTCSCINKNIAGRTDIEYRNDNKEKIKESRTKYRESNREHINQQKREWRANKKEIVANHYKNIRLYYLRLHKVELEQLEQEFEEKVLNS